MKNKKRWLALGLVGIMTPVSYTHLDVYKRQAKSVMKAGKI